jgi:arylformamidase
VIHDVTLSLRPGMVTYPGEPGFSVSPVERIADGHSANLSHLCMGSHTGTHIDAPVHFLEGGATVDDLPLDALVGPAVVVSPDAELITADLLSALAIPKDATRILFKTRNSALLHQPTFSTDFVSVDPSGAQWLVDRGVKLVGVDYLSVEKFRSEKHETHLILLGAGIPIIEGLDLGEVQPGSYDLICLPLRVPADGCPVRALLIE